MRRHLQDLRGVIAGAATFARCRDSDRNPRSVGYVRFSSWSLNILQISTAEISHPNRLIAVADPADRGKPTPPFLSGLFLLSAGTLMYEIVLTRLLTVLSWYCLAFVSVSMAMLGMTAGALFVQLRPHLFLHGSVASRLRQFSLAMAVAMPLALVTILAIPTDLVPSIESLYAFVLFCAIIATPFVFSGVAICLALTRSDFAVGEYISLTCWELPPGAYVQSRCWKCWMRRVRCSRFQEFCS